MAIANILGCQSLDRNTVLVSKYQNVCVLEYLIKKIHIVINKTTWDVVGIVSFGASASD